MRKFTLAAITTVVATFSMAAVAQQKPIAYPAKGQTAQQQGVDDSECLGWARQSTGIDPAAVAAAPVATTGPQGERARGAVRGAVGGAVIGGATGGSSNKGAAAGATVGVMAGGARSRRNQAAQVEQGQAAKGQAMDTYYRAYASCMEGRGYTVN